MLECRQEEHLITRIAQKRTSQERKAWEGVRDLMPRGRKTRGLQYEVLEYLFEHLYEKVSEADLRDYLIKVKGPLQKTGDPVKGAINLAIKELQRLPDRVFDLIKLQEADISGRLTRSVQLTYNRYEDVIGFDEYKEYLQDLLEGESNMVVRLTVAHLNQESSVFPGFARWTFEDHWVEAVLCLSARELVAEKDWECRFTPDSPIGGNMLLVYEDKSFDWPFLAFICDDDRTDEENSHFILYRGQEKISKLKFLDRLWRASFHRAQTPETIDAIAQSLKDSQGFVDDASFQGNVLIRCMESHPVGS